MAADVVEVTGARELRAALKAASIDLKVLNELHRQVADVVRSASLSRVPRRSGRLASTVRTGATRTSAIVRAGGVATPYAGPVHWGWSSRPNRAKGWRGGPIPANPFIANAAKDTQMTWIRLYDKHINDLTAVIGTSTSRSTS